MKFVLYNGTRFLKVNQITKLYGLRFKMDNINIILLDVKFGVMLAY